MAISLTVYEMFSITE